jgi:hypothetical protein
MCRRRQVEIGSEDGSAARPHFTVYSGVLVQAAVPEETAIEVQRAGQLDLGDLDISPIRHPDLVDLPTFVA